MIVYNRLDILLAAITHLSFVSIEYIAKGVTFTETGI